MKSGQVAETKPVTIVEGRTVRYCQSQWTAFTRNVEHAILEHVNRVSEHAL